MQFINHLQKRNAIILPTGVRGSASRLQPWPVCLISWILIVSQLWYPYHSCFSAIREGGLLVEPDRAAETNSRQSNSGESFPINRKVSHITRLATVPTFSDPPTDNELFKARILQERLVPSGPTSSAENQALAAALLGFLDRTDADDDSSLQLFLQQFPESAWRIAVLTDLGLFYRRAGYLSQALDAWEEAWSSGRNLTNSKIRPLVDLALGELADLNSRLGRFERLENLFREAEGRSLRGPGAQKITAAREGLAMMTANPEKAFRCGPMALERILAFGQPNHGKDLMIDASRSTQKGISLDKVSYLAQELGMNYQVARRLTNASLVLPAVVHWNVGHYGALIREDAGRYLLQDPILGNDVWISRNALNHESSGYFLVPEGQLPPGWVTVALDEAAKIWGKGETASSDNKSTSRRDKTPCLIAGNQPMAEYTFHLMLVSLNIADTPLGYQPSVGPAVRFQVSYNQREAYQPANFAYSNLGPQWTFDWISCIDDQPTLPNVDVIHCARGGGAFSFTQFDSGSQSFAAEQMTQARLVRTSSTSYTRTEADGSFEVFDLPDGPTNAAARKVFMTKAVDSSGNTNSFSYDNDFRLVSVTDAIGLVTTLAYEMTNDIYKITKVTDPFGREASFVYNGNGQLESITDILGITSEFTYDGGDFITSLTTPYGTTTFQMGETNRMRWLEATDPLGQKERVEYHDKLTMYPSSTPDFPAEPTDLYNGLLNMRNSFYWDKKAMAEAPGDYTQARLYHWLHATLSPNTASRVLESEKAPLESRIWYSYPGQGWKVVQSYGSQPATVSRVLDDGSTQIYRYSYSTNGHVIKETDPVGRSTTNIYHANSVDLLQVAQMVGGATERLASFTYNAQHKPQCVTDAAGNTNYFGYNARGQVVAQTNALGQTVRFAYNGDGYVTNITKSTPESVTSITYDGTNRIDTITDSHGYTLVFDYDPADRVTRITYPDSTYEQMVYERLDLSGYRDRLGRWTQRWYDPLQRLTQISDGLGQITQFDWCGCGTLSGFVDPMGRLTSWARDIQGRVTAKLYPDNRTITYSYETNNSRLKHTTDAMGQQTIYSYLADDNIQTITFSNSIAATPCVSFQYDSSYNRLAQMTDGEGTTTYTYHEIDVPPTLDAGRLATVNGPWSNDTISYNYDELGRVQNRAINGVSQRLTFDSLGRMVTVTNSLGAFTNAYVAASSRVSTNFYPNGQKTILSYFGNTNNHRLEEIRHLDPAGDTISKFNYTYWADGQVATWSQQTNSGLPKDYVFGYDAAKQLIDALIESTGPGASVLKRYGYTYDSAGNRIGEQIDGSPSLATHNNLNQLTATSAGGPVRFAGYLSETGQVVIAGTSATMVGQTNFWGAADTVFGTNIVPVVAMDMSYNLRTNEYAVVASNNVVANTSSYDLNGNLTISASGLGTNTYEWDAANRLITITRVLSNAPTRISRFTYDGMGRRIRQTETTNGVTERNISLLWCGWDICEERNADGGTVSRRFFGRGEEITGTNYFLLRDHLGSVREVTDVGGTIKVRNDYDPFGRRTIISGTLDVQIGFTGHYVHSPSGLYLAPFRAYDANSGRWLNRDPLHEAGGANLYGYVQNDPINAIDPTGEYPVWGWISRAGTAVAVGILMHEVSSLESLGKKNAGIDTANPAELTDRHLQMGPNMNQVANTAKSAAQVPGLNFASPIKHAGPLKDRTQVIIDGGLELLDNWNELKERGGDGLDVLLNRLDPTPVVPTPVVPTPGGAPRGRARTWGCGQSRYIGHSQPGPGWTLLY